MEVFRRNADGQIPGRMRQSLAAARVAAGPYRPAVLVLYEPGQDDNYVLMSGNDFTLILSDADDGSGGQEENLVVRVRARDEWRACRPRWPEELIEVIGRNMAWRAEIVGWNRKADGMGGENGCKAHDSARRRG